MELKTYLKQLTKSERELLALSIGSKASYIEKLKTGSGSASFSLFCKIRSSAFNNNLPASLRLKEDDEVRYRKMKVAKRAK